MSTSAPTDGPSCDLLIKNGTVYDGSGRPGVVAEVAVTGGKIEALGANLGYRGRQEIDAAGCWVAPGFLDIHTHYDAEVEAMPGLEESLRHGVTTVVMGNCSLSTALGTEKDLLDLFCRVESLPRHLLSKWIAGRVTWQGIHEYYDHLETLPVGPNVASFIGHSNIRAHVMGMERSLTVARARPDEIERMRRLVEEAMETGYLGLSIDMLPWHRLDGEPFKGISVPSQHAHPHEYRRLADVVRRFGRVLQATPNALTKRTVAILGMMSTGLFRRPLRTTIVAAMDVKTNRKIWRIATVGATVLNRLANANIRWQALAEPFLNFCDGVYTPLFEEFPTGVAAITASADERRAMLADPKFRADFKRDWLDRGERVFHRNLGDMWIVSCPDPALAGRSFQEVADERGVDALEMFVDMLAEWDSALRWKTAVTNDRPRQRQQLLAHPATLPGFNDSGAHNRNMAFQDGALQMLQQVLLNPNLMSIERAIAKLTAETAEWIGVDAGRLSPGRWADVVVIDPAALRTGLSEPIEFYDERLEGCMRMVKRSDGVVRQVLVGGRPVFADGRFAPEVGRQRIGRLLRSTR